MISDCTSVDTVKRQFRRDNEGSTAILTVKEDSEPRIECDALCSEDS